MIRYNKLAWVALNVARSRRFYEDLAGLQPDGQGPSGEALFRLDGLHQTVALHQSPQAGFKRFGWRP